MAKDWYCNYGELAASESKDDDYGIAVYDRCSNILIMAPHGGAIEPATSEIAHAIAGSDFSIYLFEGLKPGRKHCELHITSASFDEPQAIEIARNTEKLIAIHGRADKDDPDTVWLGGLDSELVKAIKTSINAGSFKAIQCSGKLAGKHTLNICNRSNTNKGVQLEIPRTLRNRLKANTGELIEFSNLVRDGILGN
jgi:phage replication-related protein YjqB (UPF0714/DUF867 family)